MHVQCPECGIAYDVPDHLLVGHKTLRCARCGTQWTPETVAAEAPEASPVPRVDASPVPPVQVTATPPVGASPFEVEAPAALAHRTVEERSERMLSPSAMQRLAVPVEPPRRSPWVGVAWIATLIVLGALAGSAVVWRADVMHVWPPSTRAYVALGLGPSSP